MNIASVIVDVPSMQTDQTYDYVIPNKWRAVIQPGMRVVVPFGPRKIQGFTIAIKNETKIEKSKLKEIVEPMDLVPVLNEDLLHLADWLTEHTLCFKISAFQVMLPAALKAKYEKKVHLHPQVEPAMLPETIRPFFLHRRTVSWKEVLENDMIHVFQKETAKGTLEVVYKVKGRLSKKKVKQIQPAVDAETLAMELGSLSKNARKQQEIIQFFIEQPKPVERTELMKHLNTSLSSVRALVEKGILSELDVEVYRNPYENRQFERTTPFSLTEEQAEALRPIHASIARNMHDVFLLYGVTGSGKTEVYLQAIEKVINQGKEAIVLVPEISLTPQMVTRFKGRFGEAVAVLHSGLSAGEKYDEWRKIQRAEVKVVVGARSAIFAPFENLGIIIIDEEHETSYKQEDNPRYHARDVAIHRAKVHQCPVVLGSATPSLESFARAQKGVYHLLTLASRMNEQALPKVDVVDMREELRAGNRSMFSTLLYEKLVDRLEKKQQTVLFLNRRGHSSFIMCRDCGYVVHCPHCDISLTYHRFSEQMKCHYCGFEAVVPRTCPECQSEHIRYFGTGTQKVEEELGKILPEARVIRMDVDTTTRKGSHERLLTQFQQGKGDILLGTQMIAKGLDFPNITLVGVLSADTMLHLPDFRSSEKTFQLLTQVSGRAGRHQLPGEVVIQTYTPEHYSIELAGQQNYDHFYRQEMMVRKMHDYPPFYFLALITVSHEQVTKVVKITNNITSFVRSRISNKAVILGPVASPIPRIKNRYRYQCLIKYKREPALNQTLKDILVHYQAEMLREGLSISIDVNPYIMM